MASKLEERIAKSKEHTAKLERLRRAEIKKERDIQRKKNQRRNYIIGELVTKYFPDLMSLEPGTKAENTARFAPLEAFLSVLSADVQLIQQINEKAFCNTSLAAEKDNSFSPDSPECVSGHRTKSESAFALKGDDDHG